MYEKKTQREIENNEREEFYRVTVLDRESQMENPKKKCYNGKQTTQLIKITKTRIHRYKQGVVYEQSQHNIVARQT